MRKNAKKCLRRLTGDIGISNAQYPVNYERVISFVRRKMNKIYGKNQTIEALNTVPTQVIQDSSQ